MSQLQAHAADHHPMLGVEQSPRDGWLNLYPGAPYLSTVELNVYVDLTPTSDPVVNAVYIDIASNIGDIAICVDGGFGDICYQSNKPLENVEVKSPSLSGGVARVSLWLRHLPSATDIRESNFTVYAWSSCNHAAAELRRRLEICEDRVPTVAPSLDGSASFDDEPSEKCDRQTLIDHLAIADTHCSRARPARLLASTHRERSRVAVITTVFRGVPWGGDVKEHGGEKRTEGLWIEPLAKLDPNTSFHVYSATEILPESTEATTPFEATLPPGILDLENVELIPIHNPGRAQECPGIFSYLVPTLTSCLFVCF
jgi:hypothetical protein